MMLTMVSFWTVTYFHSKPAQHNTTQLKILRQFYNCFDFLKIDFLFYTVVLHFQNEIIVAFDAIEKQPHALATLHSARLYTDQ